MSPTKAEGRCVVCGAHTDNRIGRQKPSGAWAWRAWRCANTDECAKRRDEGRRTR